jgi:hypothetical protein
MRLDGAIAIKRLSAGIACFAFSFSLFVLVPFGLAWALGKLMGAG